MSAGSDHKTAENYANISALQLHVSSNIFHKQITNPKPFKQIRDLKTNGGKSL